MTTLLTETDPAFAVRPQRVRPAWDSQGLELGCNIIVAHMSEAPKPYVYVGREMGRNRPASPLGNPYRTGDDKIGRFKRDLFTAITAVRKQLGDDTQRAMVAELLRIQTEYAESGVLNLACWCAPEACHADVIASAVVWLCSELPPEAVAGGWAMWDHGCAAEGLPWVTLGADGRLIRASKSLRIARSGRADRTVA